MFKSAGYETGLVGKWHLGLGNAVATSATCKPSRYAVITGQYPWRKSGTDILPRDAAFIP